MFNEIEEMKSKGEVEGLVAVLHSNNDDGEKGWMRRLDAAEALAQLGDKRGLDYLHQMAASPNKDIYEIALEVLNGLGYSQPVQAKNHAQPSSKSVLSTVNAKYPYLIAWTAFLALYFLAFIAMSSVATFFLIGTQAGPSQWLSSLVYFLLLLVIGFFVFRLVIKRLVLPYENKV